ncbi:uncharacterized protein [Aegilops tauschii subsp. strangulata]|uniref:uncharacterized protein n=1 Tax=Aegilops tauschii subsp. strangulata TaxID=200361 RepID=UPI003CC8DB96
MATSPANSRIRSSHGEPPPPPNQELIVDEILTRLPVAAAVRCRSVCRAWNADLASDHFVAAARHPEIVFFSPTERGVATSFYACSLPVDGGAAPSTARQLFSVSNLAGEHLLLSGKPCRGLTLVFDVRLAEYHLFNLSTGQHVALPPCETAEVTPLVPKPMRLKRFPLELSSTGLGFDPATGEHKVVRLFRNILGQQKCEVCSLTASGRRVAVAALRRRERAAKIRSCADDGSARDREHDAPIMSLSVGAERFGWVRTPPMLASRIRHLTNLDGSLCAVVHDGLIMDNVLLLMTWSRSSPSWSARCRVDMGSLPRPIHDELRGREIVPLCSVSGGQKILLATSRHKVYVYNTDSGDMEEVFDMNAFVDIPCRNSEAQLFINIGLHEERIAGVGRTSAGDSRLQVKRGGDTVVSKREVSPEVYQRQRDKDEDFRSMRGMIMQFA